MPLSTFDFCHFTKKQVPAADVFQKINTVKMHWGSDVLQLVFHFFLRFFRERKLKGKHESVGYRVSNFMTPEGRGLKICWNQFHSSKPQHRDADGDGDRKSEWLLTSFYFSFYHAFSKSISSLPSRFFRSALIRLKKCFHNVFFAPNFWKQT